MFTPSYIFYSNFYTKQWDIVSPLSNSSQSNVWQVHETDGESFWVNTGVKVS